MFDTLFDSKAAFDLAIKSFAPITRFSDLTAQTFEKAARFQVEAAIDLINHGAARLQATTQSTSPFQFAARHSELTADFFAKSNQKWQDYLKFTTELQTEVSKWASDTKSQISTVASQFTAPVRQAA